MQGIIGKSPGRPITDKQLALAKEITLPVLDREIVNQLKQIGGKELVLSVYEDFVNESNELVGEALTAYKENDIATVKSHLHTLKGSAGTVGVMQLAEIARDAEGRLKNDDTSTLSKALPELQVAYGKFLENYKEWLEEWV